jgi:transposase
MTSPASTITDPVPISGDVDRVRSHAAGIAVAYWRSWLIARADNADVRRASELIGIGPITASAAVATVGDFKQFKSGSQFAAWMGLVPRQHSSGGKNNLGGITKHGQTYLRTLFIQAAKSAVMTAHRRSDHISG